MAYALSISYSMSGMHLANIMLIIANSRRCGFKGMA